MKRFNFLIFILFVIFSSCEEKKTALTDNVRRLLIDVDEQMDFNYSQLFDTCYIIPLETRDDAFVGEVNKVILTEKSLIILDSDKSKSIFIYDLEGKLQHVINKLGEGPTEYMHPASISLSETGEEIILNDSRGMKVVRYDMEGNFVSEIKLYPNNHYSDLLAMDGNLYITGAEFDNRYKSIKVLDQNFIIQHTIDTFSSDDIWIVNGKKGNYLFEKANGEGFYYKGFNTNRILDIVDDQVMEDIQITFSRDPFEFNSGEPIELRHFRQRFNNENKFAVGNLLIDGKNFLLMDIINGGYIKMAILNKVTNEIHYVNYLNNDMDGMIPKMPGMFGFNSNSGHFITMMYPSLFNEKKEKGFREGPYKKVLKKIKVEDVDNPILFIYKFKDKI